MDLLFAALWSATHATTLLRSCPFEEAGPDFREQPRRDEPVGISRTISSVILRYSATGLSALRHRDDRLEGITVDTGDALHLPCADETMAMHLLAGRVPVRTGRGNGALGDQIRKEADELGQLRVLPLQELQQPAVVEPAAPVSAAHSTAEKDRRGTRQWMNWPCGGH